MVACGVVDDDQDEFMPPCGLWVGTHKIHTHSLEWDSNDGQGDEGGWGRLLWHRGQRCQMFLTSASIQDQWNLSQSLRRVSQAAT